MKTFSVYYNSFDQLKNYVERTEFKKYKLKSKSLLIQLFSGIIDSEIIQMVINELKFLLPNAKIIGATTCGEIVNGMMSSYKIALSFSFFENTEIFTEIVPKNKLSEYEMVKQATSVYQTPTTKAILSFATIYKLSGDLIIKAFEKYRQGIPLIGGGAGDNLEYSSQLVFTDKSITDNGIVVAFFNSTVLEIVTNYFLNWQTVGKSFVVTSVDKNRVKTINHQPAAEIYRKYIGDTQTDTVKESLEFPLIFFKDNIQLAREVICVHENSEIELSGHVEIGDTFKFSYGYVDYFIPTEKDYAEKFPVLVAESIFVYASVSHLTLLQEVVNIEITPLQKIAPVNGFFTYSEFCQTHSRNIMQNNALSVVLFHENSSTPASPCTSGKSKNDQIKNRHYSIIKTQNHLLTTINQELNDAAEEQRKTNVQMKKLLEELNEKQQLIRAHNKKMLDSIKYAKRIQTAVIPPDTVMKHILPNHFVYYQPKDIVSGDFYWAFQQHSKIYFAVSDCTGHGVPGAFMSLLGISILNEMISNASITLHATPANFLDILQYRIKNILNQEYSEYETSDGMDIALVIYDMQAGLLAFAGANQNLIILKNDEITELKGDRIAIGRNPRDGEAFSYHEYHVTGNETIYLYTDGIKDQVGGAKRRKYMNSNFKNYLQKINAFDLPLQKELVEQEFLKWKGNEEQTDDVLVMGLRLGVNNDGWEYSI